MDCRVEPGNDDVALVAVSRAPRRTMRAPFMPPARSLGSAQTKLLEQAFEALRRLAPDSQDEIAHAMLQSAAVISSQRAGKMDHQLNGCDQPASVALRGSRGRSHSRGRG